MSLPTNPAASLIVQAQSILNDLTSQASEIQNAISRQQTLIDSLLPVATWVEPEPEEAP